MTPREEEREALRKQKHMEKMAKAVAAKREKDAARAKWKRSREIRREISALDQSLDERGVRYSYTLATREMQGLEGLQGLMLRDSQRKRVLQEELEELMG